MVIKPKHWVRCLLGLRPERVPLYWRISRDWLSGRGNPLRLWDEDEPFNALMRQIARHTLNDKRRCFMMYQYAKQLARVPGEVAEVGVYKGGTARLLAKACESSGKTVHLFDTFAGMPDSDPTKDFFKVGDLTDISLERVEAFLSDCPHVRFYPGWFPATATPVEPLRFALVHIDADLYQSVMDGCRFFYPRLSPGGMLIFDDYGYLTCPGGKMAVDEFFADKPEHPCYLPTGQCVVTRLPAPASGALTDTLAREAGCGAPADATRA